MKTFTAIFVCFFIISGLASAQSQPRSGGFAAVPAPGQPAAPGAVTPQPVAPLPPGVARPTTPTQATQQQQQEQLRIVADPATNSLIIYGTAQEFQNIKNILKDLDAIPRQVLLDVMVAEITLGDNESFGVAYEIFRGQNSIFGQTFNSTGAVVNPIIASRGTDPTGNIIATVLSGFPAGMSGIIGRSNAIRAFINALATQNRIKTLASPSILATDNRPARIQVGSEIPILSSQTQSIVANSNVVNQIQYRNTGVILTVIPQVNSQGLVNLQVKQEVSDVGSEDFGKTGSPSFLLRDAETNAVVQDGETLAIGGIIQERKTRDRRGIPYLMDIPVFGRFFGTISDQSSRTELVILITPRVSRNIDESRVVTQELKNRLSDLRGELERLERERARKPQPTPQSLPPMPEPNTLTPMPQSSPQNSPAPGQGVWAPSAGQFAGGAVYPNPAPSVQVTPPTGRVEDTIRIYPTPEMQPEPVAPKPQGFALSLAPVEVKPKVQIAVAKPAVIKTAVKPGRVWAVQVAALADNKDAESMADKLRKLGHQAYVITSQVAEKIWHRVRVGKFENQNDAQELRKNLAAEIDFRQAYVAAN